LYVPPASVTARVGVACVIISLKDAEVLPAKVASPL
jgi:hypothetical protein